MMRFIALILAMAVLMYTKWVKDWPAGHCPWFHRYAKWLSDKIKSKTLIAPIFFVSLWIAFTMVYQIALDTAFGLPALLLSVLLLLLHVGPYPIQGDYQRSQALELAHSRLFAPIFWFVALGPVGLWAYRLAKEWKVLAVNEEMGLGASNMDYLAILEWPSVRATALVYGLIGHFTPVSNVIVRRLLNMPDQNAELLSEAVTGALGDTESEEEELVAANRFVFRSLILYVVLLAVFALGALVY